MVDLERIREERIKSILDNLREEFKLSIQNANEEDSEIIKKLDELNLKYEMKSEKNSWNMPVSSIIIKKINKKQFNEIRDLIIKEGADKPYLRYELSFNDGSKSILFNHDSDVKRV